MLLWILLSMGLICRVLYAHNEPLIFDEYYHLALASQISLHPENFFFPLGNGLISHPLGAVYLASIGLAIGANSVFAARLVFVCLSMMGLWGLYRLADHLFGRKTALIALFLVCFDRHLIVQSTRLLEAAYLAAVPWMLLLWFEAMETNRPASYIALGVVSAAACMFYEIAALLAAPFFLYALCQRRLGRALRTPAFWLSIVVFLTILSPYIWWNLSTEHSNLVSNAGKAAGAGLTPRVLGLLWGDVITTFVSTSWILLSMGDGMYSHYQIPCEFLMGCLYAIGVVSSLVKWRDKRHAFLLLTVFSVGIIVSMVNPNEPLNNIWWGSIILFPAIVLAAQMAGAWTKERWGLAAAIVLGALFVMDTGFFLSGPKFTYTSFSPEKRMVATMTSMYKALSGEGMERVAPQAYKIALDFTRRHPNSFLGYYYLARLSFDPAAAKEYLAQAFGLSPQNPALFVLAADRCSGSGSWDEALSLLQKADRISPDSVVIKAKAANAALNAGMYELAEQYALQALEIKPASYDSYLMLFLSQDALGKSQQAQESLAVYISMCFLHPWEGWRSASMALAGLDRIQAAEHYWGRARQLNPDLPPKGPWAAP